MDYITYELYLKLKELGWNVRLDSTKYVCVQGNLEGHIDSYEFFHPSTVIEPLPTYMQVAYWLWTEKNICIEFIKRNDEGIVVYINDNDNIECVFDKDNKDGHKTFKFLEDGIKEMVTLVLNNVVDGKFRKENISDEFGCIYV